jgi:N-methylhydantoinase A
VLVPHGAGVGSAIGFLRAPVGYEVVRSLYQRLDRFDVAAVNAMLDEMVAEAAAAVAAGSFGAPTQEMRMAAMRYVGQGHEIVIPLPLRQLTAEDTALIKRDYDAAYARFYTRPIPGSEIEVLSYIVTIETERDAPPPPPLEPPPHAVRPDGTRRAKRANGRCSRAGIWLRVPPSPAPRSSVRMKRQLSSVWAGMGASRRRAGSC